ncbi:hypothetical protein AXF42_Ash016118 [Apostasia shenzhenica]|uniref:Integrase zinc-binding domain-containing protein n=1 Tax=Apostasia shenzhenica TaxID=1088818 RepID=A0A2I0B3G1_9ASPA|nr:hypothetical protein AXF42_Ash016118 [Apostasia shenzhenica]
MDRILNYLKDETQPDNRQEARKLKLNYAKYTLIYGELYRRSYAKPLTKCLRPEEAKEVMEVVHRGECGTDARGRSLVMQILRQGFFWPNIHNANTMPTCIGSLQAFSNPSINLGPSLFGSWTS